MKNQYVGDLGDYGKYGLLRFFAGHGVRVGVNWYLTPDDERTDGCHREYLEDGRMRAYDAALYDAMRQLADKSVQSVQASGVLGELRFYNVPMDFDRLPWPEREAARTRWHRDALDVLRDTELVFLDPDNGLSAAKKASVKDAQKFVLPTEIEDYWRRGQAVVYYHHRPRKDEAGWMADKTLILDSLPDARLLAVSFNRWSCRSYVFVLHEAQYAFYLSALESFLQTEWGTRTVDGKHAFKREPV